MTDPTSDDDLISLDRWAVPLDEPVPETPPPAPPSDGSPPDTLRFPLTTEVPTAEFQPQLLRFGKVG